MSDEDAVSGEELVRALERGGFVVYRRHRVATLLERGLRAVAVPNLSPLPPQALSTVRRMTGLSVAELDALLEERATTCSRASLHGRLEERATTCSRASLADEAATAPLARAAAVPQRER